MANYIEITGITPTDSFPKISHCYPCTQICETDRLCIPNQKPPIESILQVLVHVSVCSHKVICTPMGKKLVIEGVKQIKVIYVADEPCQPVHSAHFDIPFCMFILLKDICQPIVDIFTGIEFIKVHQLDCRCLSVSVIIFACPQFKKIKNDCNFDCHNHCHDYDCYDYDCHEHDCHDHDCHDHYCHEHDCHDYKCNNHSNFDCNYHHHNCSNYEDKNKYNDWGWNNDHCLTHENCKYEDDCWYSPNPCTSFSVNENEHVDSNFYIDSNYQKKYKEQFCQIWF